MSTTLIDKNSDTYLRRMVREIRDSFQYGVYYHPAAGEGDGRPFGRICGVKFSAGLIRVRVEFMGPWLIAADPDAFFDGYGRHICASRHSR